MDLGARRGPRYLHLHQDPPEQEVRRQPERAWPGGREDLQLRRADPEAGPERPPLLPLELHLVRGRATGETPHGWGELTWVPPLP